MAAGGGGEVQVQKALQSVAQGTGWTYSLLWRLCPRQRVLVWAEGHYNGAVRTRRTTTTTVQPGPGGGEETARSRQLRELYDSLLQVGDGRPRKKAAALAPEDLTETEWFYLMCASYCFPPAVGLPGEAFLRRVHVWLCGANQVDSKVFSRAILARSAGIQTIACIPVDDGVLEIGTTEKVEEDIGLVQYARSIFMDQHGSPILMPTLSGHSTSTPTNHIINHHPFQIKMGNCIGDINVQKNTRSLNPREEHNDEMEDDDGRIDLLQTNTENDSSWHWPQEMNVGNEQGTLNVGSSSELMLIGIRTSERVREGCSNQVDHEEIPVALMVCQNPNLAEQDELGPRHHFLDEDLISSKCLQSSEAEEQAVLAENAHYVETVLTILRFNACRQTQAASGIKTYLSLSQNSSFSRWNHKGSHDDDLQSSPQRLLKSILLGAPSSYSSTHRCYGKGTSRRSSRRRPVLLNKERRRREKKLDESFIMLRSLLPFVTKMDRASILGDTIEYLKQLQRRIQELESARAPGLVDSSNTKTTTTTTMAHQPAPEKRGRQHHTSGGYFEFARAGASVEASGSCCNTNSSVGEPPAGHAGAAPGTPAGGHLRPGLLSRRRATCRVACEGEGGAWQEEQHH